MANGCVYRLENMLFAREDIEHHPGCHILHLDDLEDFVFQIDGFSLELEVLLVFLVFICYHEVVHPHHLFVHVLKVRQAVLLIWVSLNCEYLGIKVVVNVIQLANFVQQLVCNFV
jgi:hypothetical protein